MATRRLQLVYYANVCRDFDKVDVMRKDAAFTIVIIRYTTVVTTLDISSNLNLFEEILTSDDRTDV